MKMYDAGEKMSESSEVAESPKKNEKYYPHVDFDSKQFPEISKMKVGQKYMLVVEVKVTRKSLREAEGSESRESMCMEIQKVGMKEKELKGDEKTDKMVEKMYEEKEEEK